MTEPDKKADTWMPLWIGAYLADTSELTTVQHGAYLLLLMSYWRKRKPLPDDDKKLRAITKTSPAEWRSMRSTLAELFRVGDGVWWHKRVEAEILAADKRAAAAAAKAKAGAEARWGKNKGSAPGDAPSIAQAVHGQCPTPPPIPTSSVEDVSRPSPGEVCRAMKAAGLVQVNPGHPDLLRLLEAGMTLGELESAAKDCSDTGKPFLYALRMAEGRRREAAARGPVPPAAPGGRARPNAPHRHAAAAAVIFGDAPPQSPEVIDV